MELNELHQLAERTRSTREIGIALLCATGMLAIFFIVGETRSTRDLASAAVNTEIPAPNAFDFVAPIKAKAAVVYDLSTGEILYAKNADAQLPLASLTKLLTVYAALSTLSPSTPIKMPSGQIFALNDISRLTLTASLNDGANAIAEATAERENRNQALMLAGAAASVGLNQTYAINGSGLDVSQSISGGYGSALDLAKLAGALVVLSPDIALSTTEPSATAISEQGRVVTVANTDPIVGNIPRLLLSKTGYTDLAGGNLAIVFDAGIKHPVAVVVLGSTVTERFTDGMALVVATLAHYAGIKSL